MFRDIAVAGVMARTVAMVMACTVAWVMAKAMTKVREQ